MILTENENKKVLIVSHGFDKLYLESLLRSMNMEDVEVRFANDAEMSFVRDQSMELIKHELESLTPLRELPIEEKPNRVYKNRFAKRHHSKSKW